VCCGEMRTGNKYQNHSVVKWLLLVGLLVTVLLLSACELGTTPATTFTAPAIIELGTVTGEVLGSGDASAANQSFKLKKKTLTHEASSTINKELWVASTLEVYVNGILWKEVPTFLGIGPSEQVFIVRQNDEGEATITFGDGRRGARLPTGTDNVVANYRYGD